MHCICYELEISWDKIFAAVLRPVKSMKFFYLEILGYMVCIHRDSMASHMHNIQYFCFCICVGLILSLGTHTSHLECLCNVLLFWQSMTGCLHHATLPKLPISSSKTRSAMTYPMTQETKVSSVVDSMMSSNSGLCGRKRYSVLFCDVLQ